MALAHHKKTVGSGSLQKTSQLEGLSKEEKPTIKEYLVTWKNSKPDDEGYTRIKTMFHCDVKLLSSFLLTLPKDEHDFTCITDDRENAQKEARIRRLQEELNALMNPVEQNDHESEGEGDAEMGIEDEMEDADYDKSYYRRKSRPEYYESVTYFTKDGRDNDHNFYDKEEIRRFSTRSLMITEILDDCQVEVSQSKLGKTETRQNGILIGAQG